ncbi:BIR protein [Plasmodium berghei]|uniref:BIR protein n=3 Tax=Plasmodium berghei TaxID=5821 RepID=A0A509AH29_PLABA|nr:BIR protein [Plasmodium berghei ANKA]CXI22270.1 BIR protein [Plasmodium berghei]SCL83286.1 BIR protein [Plasmodium berghei]SCL86864.1 BIR protein [Plasmodium berghei]VUC54926.1 BIR protein [Plasmodium berghei ANKA]|eukprot:XP_034420746.1 BIR protein [Plasmodium berghei ANKA]
MNDYVCRRLIAVKNSISDKLDKNESYQIIINDTTLNGYCTNNKCSSNLEKINAGCLFLFDAFFKDSSVFNYHNSINIVEYVIIWLSYMLNLKKSEVNISNLKYFYDTYINGGNNYKNSITYIEGYSSYKELIDKTNMMSMNINDISKFYDAFILLCEMYIEFDEKSPNCNKYSGKAKEFVEKYKKLKEDSNITGNSSYNKLLSTLSNDYDNFKKKCSSVNCKDFPLLQEIKTTQPHVQSSKQIPEQTVETSEQIPEQTVQTIQKLEQISEVASSSSSIGNKLFTVLSIFGAIAFFLGIGYKYSLFGFRKRPQKQHLRGKLKK